MKFGEYVYKKRIQLGLTLRKFSKVSDLTPEEVSRVERIKQPPAMSDFKKYCSALGIKRGSEEYEEINHLFTYAIKNFQPYRMTKREVAKKLPLFLRDSLSGPLKDEELDDIISMVQNG